MSAERDPIAELTRALARACHLLADAGKPREAAKLAAAGWAGVRRTHARQAQHLDGVMHHIARVEQRLEDADGKREESAGEQHDQPTQPNSGTENPA